MLLVTLASRFASWDSDSVKADNTAPPKLLLLSPGVCHLLLEHSHLVCILRSVRSTLDLTILS